MANVMHEPDVSGHSPVTGKIERFTVDLSVDPLSSAFDSKFTVHAGSKGLNVPKEEIPEIFPMLYQDKLSGGTALYVHIPFCQTKCLFCGFAGSHVDDESGKRYIDAVLKEVAYVSALPNASKVPVQAVYFGGGTPSAMNPFDLHRLLDAISSSFNLANDCEITLEGRLHDFEEPDGFINAGFNRFSIGVQSFDTRLRRSLGRLSDGAKVSAVLSNLVDKGKAAVIIDLIYGLPGQTPESFIKELEEAEKSGVDGLDTYQLNVFKSTPLFKAIEEGRVPPAAAVSEQGMFYKMALEHLDSKKWHQLSLSHYARNHRERNIYNSWTKRKGNCIAIGAGAGGNIGGYSNYKIPVVPKYLAQAEAGVFYPDALSMPSNMQNVMSQIIHDVEQGYLRKSIVSVHESGVLTQILDNWVKAGLMESESRYYNLTTAGKFWGVNITQALIELICGE